MESKIARIAQKNSMKKKTSIGVAKHISQNMVAKCGGAVERRNSMQQDVRLPSMSVKKTMMMMKKVSRNRILKTPRERSVSAVNNLVMTSKNAQEIQTSRLWKTPIKI